MTMFSRSGRGGHARPRIVERRAAARSALRSAKRSDSILVVLRTPRDVLADFLFTFAFKTALETGGGKGRVTLVFPPEVSTATLVAMLRWMYRIPLHPPLDALVELHDAATRFEVKGLAAYCEQRLLQEMRADVAGGSGAHREEKHISGLSTRRVIARRDWSTVAASSPA